MGIFNLYKIVAILRKIFFGGLSL